MDDVATTTIDEQSTAIASVSMRQVIQVAIIGAIVGFLVWGVAYLLESYVLRMILCQGSTSYCSAAPQYANVLGTIVGIIIGLIGLVRLQIFRPLLVVLATTICLWDITSTASVLPWFEAAFVAILLYALSYSVFGWIARIRLFSLAAVIIFILVVIVRWVLVA